MPEYTLFVRMLRFQVRRGAEGRGRKAPGLTMLELLGTALRKSLEFAGIKHKLEQ